MTVVTRDDVSVLLDLYQPMVAGITVENLMCATITGRSTSEGATPEGSTRGSGNLLNTNRWWQFDGGPSRNRLTAKWTPKSDIEA